MRIICAAIAKAKFLSSGVSYVIGSWLYITKEWSDEVLQQIELRHTLVKIPVTISICFWATNELFWRCFWALMRLTISS